MDIKQPGRGEERDQKGLSLLLIDEGSNDYECDKREKVFLHRVGQPYNLRIALAQ